MDERLAAARTLGRGPSGADALSAEDALLLRRALLDSEELLMGRILELAEEFGYTRWTSTLFEAWRMSIVGLTGSIITALDVSLQVPEMDPDQQATSDPIAAFGVLEAQRHRARGVALPMFLGLFVYYRQAYLEVLAGHTFGDPGVVSRYVERVMDRTLVGYVTEWSLSSAEAQIQAMSEAGLAATNDKTRMMTLIDSLPIPAMLITPDGQVDVVNRAGAPLLGGSRTLGESYYNPRHDRRPPPWLADLVAEAAAAPDGAGLREVGSEVVREVVVTGPEGIRRFVAHVDRMQDVSRKYGGFAVALTDVTDRRAAEESLRRSEAQYRLLAENSSDVVLRRRLDGVVEWVSSSVQAMLGWQVDEVLGGVVGELIHPLDRKRVAAAWKSITASGEFTASGEVSGREARCEARYATADGRWRWMSLVARALRDGDGRLLGTVDSLRDIEAEVKAREALARSEERFRLALLAAPTGMAVVDLDRRFVEVNDALCRMLGRDREWLLAHGVGDVLDPEDDAADLLRREALLSSAAMHDSAPVGMPTTDGRRVWVRHSIGLQRDRDGAPKAYVSQFVDITEAKRARDQLTFQASHDILTGLVNRSELTDQMTRVLTRKPRTGRRVAVLFCDLDGFKSVNDKLGHSVGDETLQIVAARLCRCVRSGDVVARLGGDEFVVVLDGVHDDDDARRIADKICVAIAEPITIPNQPQSIQVHVSIGLAMVEPGEDSDRVLSNADAALYAAKNAGGNRTISGPATPTSP